MLKNEQCQKLPGYSILKLMNLDKAIKCSDLKEFEGLLRPHQACFTDKLGFSILERVVVEHNLRLTSKLHEYITFEKLGVVMEISPAKVEKIVCQMVKEKRLKGHVDQKHSTVYFEGTFFQVE